MVYTNEQLTATLQGLLAGLNKMQNAMLILDASITAINARIDAIGQLSDVPVLDFDFSALDNIGNGSAKEQTKPKNASKDSSVKLASIDTLSDVVTHILARKAAKQTNENILNAWRKNPQHTNEPRVYCDTVHNRKCKEYAKLNGIELTDVSALLIERLGGSKWTLHKGI